METYEKISKILEEVRDDVEKFFEKGNNTAGQRSRKALQEVVNLSRELRKEIQEIRNSSKQ